MKPFLPLTIAVSLASVALYPVSSASAMTLKEAFAAAYANNPELQAERASVRATDEEVSQALSEWRPKVSASAAAGFLDHESRSFEDTMTPRRIQLNVAQPLFNGFSTVNKAKAAQNSVLSARKALTSKEQNVLQRVADAYLNVLRDQAVLDLNVNNEQVLTRQLEASRDRFRVGEITLTDVSQAKARLAGATAARIGAEGQLNTSRAAFERLVGVPPQNLRQTEDPSFLPASSEEAIAMAEQRQPAVLAAEYAARAAVSQAGAISGELLPSLSLAAGAEKEWDQLSDQQRGENFQISVTLTFPWYQSGSVSSRLRAAKHTAAAQRLRVDQARQQAREAAIQSWDQLAAARAQIQSITAQVEAAKTALQGVEKEAQVGARTVLDVLNAEQESLNAHVNFVRAKRDERAASYALLAATGRLTAQYLDLAVDIYDPVRNYNDVRHSWFGLSSTVNKEFERAKNAIME